MKLFTLFAVCLGFFAAGSLTAKDLPVQTKPQTKQINWLTDIQKAKTLAAQQSKPILLYFSGSDWCPHCKKMDREVFSTKQFQDAINDRVIFVHVDSPKHKALDAKTKEQNSALKKQFGVSGYPTILLVDSKLKLIGKPSRKANPVDFATEINKTLALKK